MKEIVLVLIMAYFGVLGFISWHEQQHVDVYSKHGIDSYYKIDLLTLHGHTYPVRPNCLVNDCVAIGIEQDKIDGVN